MHTALADTSRTLRAFLKDQLSPPIAQFLTGTRVATLRSPMEMQDKNLEGLSIWLYRVERDCELLNRPPARLTATQVQHEPLPLRLHYLLTPMLVVGTDTSETEQEMLGKVIQTFHDQPIMEGTLLQGNFGGTDVQLRIRFEPMTLDDTAKMRDMLRLENTYQLSVSYEVSVVNIDSGRLPQDVTPVQVVIPDYGVIVAPGQN